MKKELIVAIICLLTIGSMFAAASNQQQQQGFATSIFWQCPTGTPRGQFMFSNQDPEDMYTKTYNGKDFFTATTNPELVNAAVGDTSGFTQYLLGSYFTAGENGSSFYATNPVTTPLKIKPTTAVKKPAQTGLSLPLVRLTAIEACETTALYVNVAFKWSLNSIIRLAPVIEDLYNQHYQCVYNTHIQVDEFWNMCNADRYQFVIQANTSSVGRKYGKFITATQNLGYILSTSFNPDSLIYKTALTGQSFGQVAGITHMQGSTYFPNNPIFALHLITPGRLAAIKTATATQKGATGTTYKAPSTTTVPTTIISGGTSLVDVMNQQNTYTDIYAQEGVTPCGDNFGF